jgi:hypothetical protein
MELVQQHRAAITSRDGRMMCRLAADHDRDAPGHSSN